MVTRTSSISIPALRRGLAGVLAGSALAAGAAAASVAPADAAPSAGISAIIAGANIGVSLGTQTTTVRVRRDIPTLPKFWQPAVGEHAIDDAAPGSSWDADCWTEGQPITDFGVTNNRWVKLHFDIGRQTGFGNQYLWAGGLRGDSTGGVPNHC